MYNQAFEKPKSYTGFKKKAMEEKAKAKQYLLERTEAE
jgi:hypothetical protein